MTTKSLDEVLEEIKGYYNSLIGLKPDKCLGEPKSWGKLPDVGVYIVYENNGPIYTGETGDVLTRFSKLFSYGHTLYDTLLIEEAEKKESASLENS